MSFIIIKTLETETSIPKPGKAPTLGSNLYHNRRATLDRYIHMHKINYLIHPV